MRPYETMLILSNELGDGQKAILERAQETIKGQGGEFESLHDWGKRKLAYPIRKENDGHYYLLEYKAPSDLVAELERTLRITDGVLRFMSVQQEHTGLPPEKPAERPRDYRDRDHRGGDRDYRGGGDRGGDRSSYGDRDRRSSGPPSEGASATPAAAPAAQAQPAAPAASPAPAAPATPEAAPAANTGDGVKTDE